MFVYQPTFNALDIKKDKGTDYLIGWESKGVYTPEIIPLHTAFLHRIKVLDIECEKKFDKDPLATEQSNYVTHIVKRTLSLI